MKQKERHYVLECSSHLMLLLLYWPLRRCRERSSQVSYRWKDAWARWKGMKKEHCENQSKCLSAFRICSFRVPPCTKKSYAWEDSVLLSRTLPLWGRITRPSESLCIPISFKALLIMPAYFNKPILFQIKGNNAKILVGNSMKIKE